MTPIDTPIASILAVDDDPINLDIITEYLSEEPVNVTTFQNPVEAFEALKNGVFDVILLDRMMPEMDGMEFLSQLRADPRLKDIPVIMQTASASTKSMVEGIEAGVFYYLTKPFDERTLCALINSAIADVTNRKKFKRSLEADVVLVLDLLQCGVFHLRRLEEAERLALYLGRLAANHYRTSYGFRELLVNAVEHGLLNIGYETKAKLIKEGGQPAWRKEIQRRMELPENSDKQVTIDIKRNASFIDVTITDNGPGFKWKTFTDFDPTRVQDPNGKGVAYAQIYLSEVTYNSQGNEVVCRINL